MRKKRKEVAVPKVSNEALQAFYDSFRKCTQRVGDGKVGIDSTCVRELVRANPEVAHHYVELQCFMAQRQPGHLQPAFLIAVAFQIEFQDDVLIKMVMERTHSLDAEEYLQ